MGTPLSLIGAASTAGNDIERQPRGLMRAAARRVSALGSRAAAEGRQAGTRLMRRLLRVLAIVVPVLALVLALLLTGLAHYVYFDRTHLPDLGPFIRFEMPSIGEIQDARGSVLIELALEYRRSVSYEQVPPVLRDAILAAEDKNFLSHSGVDYSALPRVAGKMAVGSLRSWWKGGSGFRVLFPQGGSTLTQQLVRGYFLQDLTRLENGSALSSDGLLPRLVSTAIGVPATNKLLRKLEEVRVTLWLEDELRRRYGTQEQVKRELFARYVNFVYLGNGRYGFAAASEYYFGRPLSSYTVEDAADAALLAGIVKCPRDCTPTPGDPRLLRRRNQILGLMARNGYIPAEVATQAQAKPIRVVARGPAKTDAPAVVDGVLDELVRHADGRFSVEDLFQGRISVRSTVDARIQAIGNQALEQGLALYEQRHTRAKGRIQGSLVVLRNSDGAILAEVGGRQVFNERLTRYSDFNRATASLRQPGSTWKPLVYFTAFQQGLSLDSTVPDEPISVPMGANRPVKWIANYDAKFKGPISVRQALAESRNAVTVWIAREIGMSRIIKNAHGLGLRSPLQPYVSTALGASEVRLLELANVYRALASGLLAEPHIVERVMAASGAVLYQAAGESRPIASPELSQIQEGLRGVIRLPEGTAHSLDSGDFPIPVMGKTGTTSDFRDALFVGSTYGTKGITVAVRIGFDDNQPLGQKETGGRAALPIFREVMLRAYKAGLVGPVPRFPRALEARIDAYLAGQAPLEATLPDPELQATPTAVDVAAATPARPASSQAPE